MLCIKKEELVFEGGDLEIKMRFLRARPVGSAGAGHPYSREVWRVSIVVVVWGWVCLDTRVRVWFCAP